MKGDFSRFTFDRAKHYRGVLMQQGRVQLDADWNENLNIASELRRTLTQDVIGDCGVPIHEDAFAIDASAIADFKIKGGRMYVQGRLVELDGDTTYLSQVDYPDPPPLGLDQLKDGERRTDLVYVDAWSRELNAIEDPHIREVALGGPDTAERLKQIAQVKVLQNVDPKNQCRVPLLPTGGGTLQVVVTIPPKPPKPCEPLAGGGYQGTENRLYRVEVHVGGKLGTAKFKWSRDNASVVAAIEEFKTPTELVVKSLGRDDYFKFKKGDYIEVTDDVVELSDSPAGILANIVDMREAERTIILGTAVPADLIGRSGQHAKIRRWDGGIAQSMTATATELESGIKTKFGAGKTDFRVGDYWTFAARAADGSIDPSLASAATPMGRQHAYGALATITWLHKGDQTLVEKFTDCRKPFPPLTEVIDPEEYHRRHNLFLHGWGVVCGLQVHCSSVNDRSVRVEKGYAIGSDGREILSQEVWEDDVVNMAGKILIPFKKLRPEYYDLNVSLGPNKRPAFALEVAPAQKDLLEESLEGTLLADIGNECVKPILEWLSKEVFPNPAEDTHNVKIGDRRRTAAYNLLIQKLNQTHGSHVFLSEGEHNLLRDIYAKVQEYINLHSTALCAQRGSTELPVKYPDELKSLGARTDFGKDFASKMRVSPDGKSAFVFGPEAKDRISFFPLGSDELASHIILPPVPGAQQIAVADVGFLQLERRVIMVVAATVGASQTALYAYQIIDNQCRILGGPNVVEKHISRVAGFGSQLYAVVLGEGLFRLTLVQEKRVEEFANIVLDQTPYFSCNALGHFEIARGGTLPELAVVSARETGEVGGNRLLVHLVMLGAKENPQSFAVDSRLSTIESISFRVRGQSGIFPIELFAVGHSQKGTAAGNKVLSIITIGPSDKAMVESINVAMLPTLAFSVTSQVSVQLPSSGPIHVAATGDQQALMMTIADRYAFYVLKEMKPQAEFEARLRESSNSLFAQIDPMSVSDNFSPQIGHSSRVLVLNKTSRTMNVIPYNSVFILPSTYYKILVDYRLKMVSAFEHLLLHLLQQVKDCACDHLLLKCPEADAGKPVRLAKIHIKGEKVLHICNLGARREVVTFDKLWYWLSIVPVVPLVTNIVRRFCCMIIGGSSEEAGSFGPDKLSTTQVAMAMQKMAHPDLQTVWKGFLGNVSTWSKHLPPLFSSRLVGVLDGLIPDTALEIPSVNGLDAGLAGKQLAEAGLPVQNVLPYEEALRQGLVTDPAQILRPLRAGDKVNIYTEDGKVVYFTRAEEEDVTVQLKGDLTNALAEIKTLKDQLAETRKVYEQQVAVRTEEISALSSDLKLLRGEFTELKKPKP